MVHEAGMLSQCSVTPAMPLLLLRSAWRSTYQCVSRGALGTLRALYHRPYAAATTLCFSSERMSRSAIASWVCYRTKSGLGRDAQYRRSPPCGGDQSVGRLSFPASLLSDRRCLWRLGHLGGNLTVREVTNPSITNLAPEEPRAGPQPRSMIYHELEPAPYSPTSRTLRPGAIHRHLRPQHRARYP